MKWDRLYSWMIPEQHGCYQPTDKLDTDNPPYICYEAETKHEPIEPFASIYELNKVALRSHEQNKKYEAGKLLLIIKRKIAQYEENEMYKH